MVDGKTVLIVEDDEIVRQVLADHLRGKGCEVLESGNGLEALDIAENVGKPIYLLVADVVVPGLSGVALQKGFGVLHPNAHTVFISGYAEESVVKNDIIDKGFSFLEKPFMMDDFDMVLDSLSEEE